jgi:hypothetical protein
LLPSAVELTAVKVVARPKGTTSTQSTSSTVLPANELLLEVAETYALETPPQVIDAASLAVVYGAEVFASAMENKE